MTVQIDQTPPQQKPNFEEKQYLALCERIIAEGEDRPDRTGTGTKSIFAPPPRVLRKPRLRWSEVV